MSKAKEFVATLSDKEKHDVIASYELFKKQGFVGDEPIRLQAQNLMDFIGDVSDSHITMWMEQLAKECYRYFYHKHACE